jgi:hypothetical protein
MGWRQKVHLGEEVNFYNTRGYSTEGVACESSLGAGCGKIIIQVGWDWTGRETDAVDAREVQGGNARCTTSGGRLGTPDEGIFFADVL